MKIIVGTNNHGKLQEMQQAIDSEAVQLVTYQEYLPESVEIEETGNTYVENALLKAKFYAEKINRPVLADDGGLELIAFPALLGLKTARFFNENLSEQQKNQQLLELFNGKPELTREIQLKSTLVYAWPEGHYLTSSETLKGELAKKITGDLGYGFDSIFYLPELGCTLAQLSKATRDTYSPRVIALKKMIEKIKEENCDENESLFLGE